MNNVSKVSEYLKKLPTVTFWNVDMIESGNLCVTTNTGVLNEFEMDSIRSLCSPNTVIFLFLDVPTPEEIQQYFGTDNNTIQMPEGFTMELPPPPCCCALPDLMRYGCKCGGV